ncbi:MAG: hypothetical protein AEth_01314 [Candidatus Argoarchaeum ethanivorans]|uniref:Pyrrolo-quinoline quinone repeat domain-containing protein n=1 Tax=Candidatus Argoarchaeum ethanivorans TaxID=2608793 RepID=A0A8B3S267_9EURY|nr:MAG: hypothetical protein AEth_01314 [Candidatus Argoarchaeum ethanivorans]
MNAKILTTILLLALTTSIASADWSQFHHNPERTGNVSGYAPVTNTIFWETELGCFVEGGACISNGRVYVANRIGGSGKLGLYCLNEATGEIIWHNPIGGSGGVSTPAILGDRLFVGSLTGDLYCVNALNGTTIWNRTIELKPSYWGVGSCPLIHEDTVFVNTVSGGAVFAFGFDGNELWNITTGSYGEYPPAVAYYISPAAYDRKIFFGGAGPALYCVDIETQNELWNFSTTGTMSTTPAIDCGIVYLATGDRMYAVGMDGIEVWSQSLKGTISSPAISDGKIYIGDKDKKINCINATDGIEIWNQTLGGKCDSSPVVANGMVYTAANYAQGTVYGFDAEIGDLKWTYDTCNWNMAQPAISDGILFIGSDSGYLYAFRDLIQKGDLNLDWAVTVDDAFIALKMAVGAIPAVEGADMNGDSKVTSLDALMILQMALGAD